MLSKLAESNTPHKVSLRFEKVTKQYRLGSGHSSLREAIASLPARASNKSRQQSKDQHQQTIAALNQVSFEIGQGESVGFIGPNGSGKTTTLKVISGITRATKGNVYVNGRVSALIELGAGFHPDLTGRENIYFNGAILGMKRQEIHDRFDDIVDFSGLKKFLDTPVKRYSSGMYCRLGFSVAAHVNPDLLLVDEVLAVGDSAFQTQCLKRMNELQTDGTTIVFVTHNLGYLQRLSQRAIFLDQGKVMVDGPVDEVIAEYRDNIASNESERATSLTNGFTDRSFASDETSDSKSESSSVIITGVRFNDEDNMPINRVRTGEGLNVIIEYIAYDQIENANIEIWLYSMDGTEYASFASRWDGINFINLEGEGQVCLKITPVCLMPGTYFCNVAISDQNGLEKYDIHWERHKIVVLSGPVTHGLVYLPHKWDIVT